MAPPAALIDGSQERCLFFGNKQSPLIHTDRLIALPGVTTRLQRQVLV